VLLDPGNRSNNVVLGGITEVVLLASRIAMCSQSDKQDGVTGSDKPLSLIEAICPRAAVAMKEQHWRAICLARHEPRSEFLVVG
jgi:hypothetical protein